MTKLIEYRDEWPDGSDADRYTVLPRVVLAIDPGPTLSAFVVLDPSIRGFGKWPNDRLLAAIRDRYFDVTDVVLEKIESFGMAVGAEIFETVYVTGQFAEAARYASVSRVSRRAVKLHLCGSVRAKDPNVRQALIDKLGPIGRKSSPGPLYGISGDEWSALAVGVTFLEAPE